MLIRATKTLALLAALLLCPASSQSREPTFDFTVSGDALNTCMRDRFVTVDHSGIARLCRSWLLATDSGIYSKRKIALSDATRIKKRFDIPLSGTSGADLYIFRGGGKPDEPMVIHVNGRRIEHTEPGMAPGRGWRRQPIAEALLRKGPNTFIFSGNGWIADDNRSPRVASAVSYDGGSNWHPTEGETILRLRLHGYPPQGILTSGILDIGRIQEPYRTLGPYPSAASARLHLKAKTPRGTDVKTAWRVGSTPTFNPRTWTAWQSGRDIDQPFRYAQWRLTLQTRNAERTPSVESVTMEIQPSDPVPVPSWLDRVAEVAVNQPEVRTSSYSFEYETATPRIRYLADRIGVDSLTDPNVTDLEATSAIRHWISRRWKNGWNAGHYRYIPPWDALILLDMAPDNLCLGMCTHYATAYVQASIAAGFVSRHLIVDHHCLAETFINDHAAWILQDPGPGAGPDGFPVGVRFERDGKPLNALDMHRLIADDTGDRVTAIPHPSDGEPHAYGRERNKLGLYCRFGIPLRNNHLSVPCPAEDEHGQDHYRYNGYLWWTDNPDTPEEGVACYSLLSNRPADFYPTLNAARIDLEAHTRDVLNAHLWTSGPNTKQIEVRVDSTDWQPADSTLAWPLHEGTNRLAARAVNVFGQAGPVSEATVVIRREDPPPSAPE